MRKWIEFRAKFDLVQQSEHVG